MSTLSPSPLERFLNLFAEVRPREGTRTLLLTFNVFLLLATYYMIKPVREALILADGSAELKSYLSLGQTALLLLVVPLYSRLAGRLPRGPLITGVTLFFAACLVVFFALARLEVPNLSIVFFLWVGIFNLMIVAQFWSFANDIHTPEEGKRLFAIIAFGASAGAVVGSYVLGEFIDTLGLPAVLLAAAGTLLAALGMTLWVMRGENRSMGASQAHAADEPIARGDAFALVLRTRYLLLIALMILVLNWVNTNGEYLLGRVVKSVAEGGAAADAGLDVRSYIGNFYGRFFLWVNVASLLIQLFLVSRLIKYLGVRICLLILPVIALLGNGLIAFVPILAAVRWGKTAENATDYSLQNTLRGVLFLPTTREQKYTAKQAIDTFFVRAGDVLSTGTVWLGAGVLALSTSAFAIINLGLVVLWLVLAVLVGRRYAQMTAER